MSGYVELKMEDTNEKVYGLDSQGSNRCRETIMQMLIEVAADTMQVFDFGARKHPDSGDTPNFLTENGNKCSLHDRGSSILRHSARTFGNPGMLDAESNLPELLHLLASVSIMYIRHKRNITHPVDSVGENKQSV